MIRGGRLKDIKKGAECSTVGTHKQKLGRRFDKNLLNCAQPMMSLRKAIFVVLKKTSNHLEISALLYFRTFLGQKHLRFERCYRRCRTV